MPTPEGKALAGAIDAGKTESFQYQSQRLRDGPDGDRGALIALRSGPAVDDAAVVFKATSQGLGHGHFDRLSLIYYDNGDEILADYGAARFLNVEPKNGGKYLPENTSWAKQSVAHNTLVVDQKSHFNGDWRAGEEAGTKLLAYDGTSGASFAAAELDAAYDGVTLRRVIAMVDNGQGGDYIIDVMQGIGEGDHTYDLPLHFKGQLIETSFPFAHATDRLVPLGVENGYQHLWKTAETPVLAAGEKNDLSLVVKDKFYTMTLLSNLDAKAFLNRLGANDPDNNLRNEQSLILRAQGPSASFLSVYERHGRYDNDEEVTVFSGGSVEALGMDRSGSTDIYSVRSKTGTTQLVLVAEDTDPAGQHTITYNGETISWTGPVGLHTAQAAGEAAESRGG